MPASAIEWTQHSWNCVTGCSPVSSGCKHCYAKRMHARLRAMGSSKYAHDWNEVVMHEDELDVPLRRKKPTVFFVNSMSDTFHGTTDAFLLKLWARFAVCKQHSFIVLTKRAKRMHDVLSSPVFETVLRACVPHAIDYPLPNVIGMVSVCSQAEAQVKIPQLLRTPLAVRGVSCEPMLTGLDLYPYMSFVTRDHERAILRNPTTGLRECCYIPIFTESGTRLDWIICGHENAGRASRRCSLNAVRWLRDQCIAAGRPFFLKQLWQGGKLVKMPRLDGAQWAQVPQLLKAR